MEKKFRKLRSIVDVLHYIRTIDRESAVTRFMIARLVEDDVIYHTYTGKKILVDLDETIAALGLV